MASNTHILLMRFRLKEERLRGQNVSILPFPRQAVNQLIQQTFDETGHKRPKPRDFPSYRQLDTVISAIYPHLVHPFRKNDYLLALLPPDDSRLPTPTDLQRIILGWAELWLENRKLSPEQIDRVLKRLSASLAQFRSSGWEWQQKDLYELWSSANGIRYAAVPSLLALLLAKETAQNPYLLEGTSIRWQLAQSGGDKLILVSNLQTVDQTVSRRGREDEVRGAFAYQLEFSVQTYAGAATPFWINAYVSFQRYIQAEETGIKLNYRRDARVLTRLNSQSAGQRNTVRPPFIPLFLRQGKKNRKLWRDNVVELLDKLGVRGPIEAEALSQRPQDYWRPSRESYEDEYRIVYSEGMEPNHGLETGLSMEARRQTMVMIDTLLSDWLTADEVIPQDLGTFRQRVPLTLLDPDEIAERSHFPKTAKARKADANAEEARRIKVESLRKAVGLRPGEQLTILLCCHSQRTREMLIQQIKWLFSGGKADREEDELPSLLHLPQLPNIVQQLIAPVSDEQEAIHKRAKAWDEWLKDNAPTGQARLAIIELPFPKNAGEEQRNRLATAIRSAFVEQRIHSQFILPVENPTKDLYRARNAVCDLLLRQTGTVFQGLDEESPSPPGAIYKMAGMPAKIAETMLTVALYRARSTTYDVDYALAVRWRWNGLLEARLPGSTTWKPYMAACLDMGQLFAQSTPQDNKARLTQDELQMFVYSILSENKENLPMIALVRAEDWRWDGKKAIWKQLANNHMVQNRLDFREVKDAAAIYEFTPHERPNLRVIRLRYQQGFLGETPQYVALVDPNWRKTPTDDERLVRNLESKAAAFGFVDQAAKACSGFMHYASIGRLPESIAQEQTDRRTMLAPKHMLGGLIPFKHQTVVEIVPFFYQEQDETEVLARCVSFIRQTPGWSLGNTLLPYPMHLAACAIEDMLCLCALLPIESEIDADNADS